MQKQGVNTIYTGKRINVLSINQSLCFKIYPMIV